MRRATPKDTDLKALQVNQVKQASAAKAKISPELDGSSKKFDKDYVYDKRPAANPFHFKHPYPIVQDSGDYDKDFVKDENSDDGSFAAQQTYDQLRSKLRKERKQLAEALKKKNKEEQEMRDALKQHDREAWERLQAAKKADELKKKHHVEEEEEEKKHPGFPHHEVDEVIEKVTGEKDVTRKIHVEADLQIATGEVQKKMRNLEDCKKELEAARQKLKDLMKELEDAKKKQADAEYVLDGAKRNELAEHEHGMSAKKYVETQHQDYLAAKDELAKAKALVAKLEVEIKAAAAEVKAIRDNEDANGGVYNTGRRNPFKSGAQSARWMWVLPMAILAACCA